MCSGWQQPGLSAEQKNDFQRWKHAWDEAMLSEHGDAWPEVFAGWIQKVQDDREGGALNAFSQFVHNETRRCLRVAALRIP